MSTPPEERLLTLTAGPVAHGGHMVARVDDAPDGRVVFVRGALPGERVRVRLTDSGEGKSFWRGEAVEVLEASPHRVEPPCPYARPGGCGGCDLQHVELAEQRRLKAAVVTEQLRRLGHVDVEQVLGGPVVVQALPEPGRAPGGETGLGWRTRVGYAVDRRGRPGFHAHRSHTVVPVERCPQVTDAVDAVGVTRLPWPGVGAVRVSAGDDGAVVRAEHGPRRTRLPHVDAIGLVAGTGERPERVAGRTWVRHDVPGAGSLRVGVDGFWQAHASAAETFVRHVRRHAGVRPGDTVLDLYAGAGLFTLALAGDLAGEGELVAVESDRGGTSDLRRNVHDHPVVRVVHDRVERALRGDVLPDRVDVVVLDPPRAGARSAVVEQVVRRAPRAVVYVACDPAALGRDTALLAGHGYRLRALEALDAYPMTHHVEAVALFTPDTVPDILTSRDFRLSAPRPLRQDGQPRAGTARATTPQTLTPPETLLRGTTMSAPQHPDTFSSRDSLEVGGTTYDYYRLDTVEGAADLPFSLKVLLENLLRTEDGVNVTADAVRALGGWQADAEPDVEIQFTPGRVVMQDFTGVPCIVDLATMREAVVDLGGDPAKVNPLAPAELVIDHSVIVDSFGSPDSLELNMTIEYERNRERYQFLRWGQTAFSDFVVVPPGVGIVHQVNLEHLARGVMTKEVEVDGQARTVAYPDTLVGTDSHTTMINGIGVLGWGVGGIEAEAAMLGQPVSMLIPRVVGFKLTGSIPVGVTATDVVLTITEQLRAHGVVGKFVEFYGDGVAAVPLANRATIGNMSPEFGSTCAIFPVDEVTTEYLRLTGRSEQQVALVEAYCRAQGLWHDPQGESYVEPRFSEYLELDLSSVVPSIAGPKRPQDRIALSEAREKFLAVLPDYAGDDQAQDGGVTTLTDQSSAESFPASDAPSISPGAAEDEPAPGEATGSQVPAQTRASRPTSVTMADGTTTEIDHGAVVIAAITSCTNTSNPTVMVAAALLAKKAVERGLGSKPWVKTSLAPGSKVVMDYYEKAGLTPYLDKLGFNLVGYGCTTCIGNSGPLPAEVSEAVQTNDLAVVSVLSGNRNFEGRINPDVKMNYLASPPLVVAYALVGTMDFDFDSEPVGTGTDGAPVMLADIWPAPEEVQQVIDSTIDEQMFAEGYADVFAGDQRWQSLPTPEGDTFAWDQGSTYVRKPPYFDGMSMDPAPVTDVTGARVLALLGDSVTTDHISPAGAIKPGTPAAAYLEEHGVGRTDFNSYGSRRGNHEVMIRGTFANIRLRNQLLDGVQGGYTRDFTAGGEQAFIYDAAQRYAEAGTPLVVLAGKEYGSGSSRDWAAKGTALLGVKVVLAESFERIHRSNLIGMGVLPLQFPAGESAASLGLDGTETFDVTGITALQDGATPRTVRVVARGEGGREVGFDAVVRIDTPGEADYYRNGGILQFVLRSLARA